MLGFGFNVNSVSNKNPKRLGVSASVPAGPIVYKVIHPDDVIVADFEQSQPINLVDGAGMFAGSRSTLSSRFGDSSFAGSGSGTRGFVTPVYIGPTEDFTIEFWVKRNAGSPDTVILSQTHFLEGEAGLRPQLTLSGNTAVFSFINGDGTLDNITTGSNTYLTSDLDWHHIAISRQGTTMKMWLDGVLGGNQTETFFDMELDFRSQVDANVGFQLGYSYPVLLDNFRVRVGSTIYWNASFTPTNFVVLGTRTPVISGINFQPGTGIGWDETVQTEIRSNKTLTPLDNIQNAVDTAHAAGHPYIISLRGGVYRQSVVIPTGADGITIQRYAGERPVLTGADLLTGWGAASISDEPVVGAGYTNLYKTILPVASVPHATPRLLNIHYNGNRRYIAQDMAGYVDPVTGQVEPGDRAYIEFDDKFHDTDVTYTYDGSNNITAITSQTVFETYTQSQLEANGVILSVYCADNRVALASITSYDPATFTAQVSSTSGSFVRATNDREAFGIANIPAAIQEGEWAALRDGSNFVIYYWPQAGESANLNANMEYSKRGLGIDIGGCNDLTLRGLDLVQYETNAGLTATCIGSSSSGRRAEAKTGLSIQHCRMAQTSGADYGALLVAGSTGSELSRITLDDIDGFGGFVRDSTDVITTGIHARRCGQAGLRVFTVNKGLFSDMLFEENGRSGHANQLNFYEGCNDIAVAFFESKNCFGYVTHQEASNVTYYMSSIMTNRDIADSGRAIVDQNRGANAGQGGPDGSGAPVADSDFRYIGLDLIPYDFSGTSSLSVGGGDGTLERSIILNNVLHGGGHSKVYTDARSATREIRDGNIYTDLSFWQTIGSGWSLAANEISTNVTSVYTDLTGRDIRHRGGSPVRGAVGVDITSHVEALEALWPGVNFRRDLRGVTIDPATPPVGAISDRGEIPITAPSVMTAPTLGNVTSDGLDVILGAAPNNNGSAITSYDIRYAVNGGSWITMLDVGSSTSLTGLGSGTDVIAQSRAVNAIGVGDWSPSGLATTTAVVGLPDGIVGDPSFQNPAVWDVATGATIDNGANFVNVAQYAVAVQNDFDDLFPITAGQNHELSFTLSRFVNTGTSRLRFLIDYYNGPTTGATLLGNSGNIGGSTIVLTGVGDYGPFSFPAPPAGATHGRIKILPMNTVMDVTVGKISIVEV